MTSLIIGTGQIGKAVKFVLLKAVNSSRVYTYDKKYFRKPKLESLDILHICIPYSDKFIDDVKDYIKYYKPWHVIIWSTVPIGTTKQIKGAVHSPIEGRHPNLQLSIRSMVRWVGANDESEGEFFTDYFQNLYMRVHVVNNSDYTEFLKLRSTAKYGINLVWTDYEASVAKEIDMDFDMVKQFDSDYNRLYHNINMTWAQRYILDPPNGKIGGHCVVPNAELLDEQFPHELLKKIKEYK